MLRAFTVCLLLSAPIVFAAEENRQNIFDYGWFVSGMWSYIDDDAARNADDGLAGYHIGVGRGFKNFNAFEINVVGTNLSADVDANRQRQEGLGIDYMRRIGKDGDLSPYALFGAGWLKTRYYDGRETNRDMSTSVGLGLFIPISSTRFFLRTEVRARKDYSTDGLTDYLINFGLHLRAKDRIVIPVDSDYDSVSNDEDRCPNTPANVAVDRFGCVIK